MNKTKIILNGLLSLLLLSSINNSVAEQEPYNLSIKKLNNRFDSQHWGFENPITSTEKTFTYYVPLHKSRLISLDGRVKKISKGNPGTANILLFPPNQLFLQGRRLGTTNVMVWNSNNKIIHVINIEVTHDLESLKAKLFELLPKEQIHVRSVQKNIVLSGEVSGLDAMQAAIDIAQSFLGSSDSNSNKGGAGGGGNSTVVNTGNSKKTENSKGDVPRVINLMSVGGGQQVMLEVTIAEIDRQLFRGLDVNFNTLRPSSQIAFGALNGGGSFSPILSGATSTFSSFSNNQLLSNSGGIAGPLRTLLNPSEHSVDAAGVFLSAVSGSFIFNLTIDAAKNQQLAKILAEPVLTTLSGQEATFVSGGEFPIPVPQSNSGGSGNSITVEFKEFGVTMKFLPIVLDSGRINLNLNVGVSELSSDAAVFAGTGETTGFSIPSLTKREASSTLELADGQTMSIAGLISDRVRSNVDKFPGLGDIPVLGTLFRSESFIKDRTELVFFVTPRLAKPIAAEEIKLPTDTFIEPDDLDFYALGRLDSRNAKAIVENNNLDLDNSSGGLEGQYGHQIIEEDNSL